ncbi:head GIN domain-containing protein [uncultured Draconibacterium sp.]|uniref:head GIN domain-containing protein n=1 Tax=uncultured Draconibacterium sp. TaxID=1573823 RepID=UPI0032169EEE
MKTFKNLLFLALIIFVGTNTVFAGNMDQSEVRTIESFNSINVSDGIDLFLSMGETEKLSVTANGAAIDDVKTEIKDGTLYIFLEKNDRFKKNKKKALKVYVTATELNAIEATSGADIRTETSLQGESLTVKSRSGSYLELSVFYTDLIVANSGSDIKLSGKVKNFKAESNNGSELDAYNLEAQIGKLKAGSGSNIAAMVTDELYTRASNGSSIDYLGDPRILNNGFR